MRDGSWRNAVAAFIVATRCANRKLHLSAFTDSFFQTCFILIYKKRNKVRLMQHEIQFFSDPDAGRDTQLSLKLVANTPAVIIKPYSTRTIPFLQPRRRNKKLNDNYELYCIVY
jgi:hypothetical protein